MMYEIVGARAIGPYFGTSIFIWTSLIGIIFGSLSVGYWIGGWISTKRSDISILSWILIVAAIFIIVTAIADNYILDRILKYILGIRLQTVVSVILLFTPASILLGMVLPYAIKLQIGNLKSSGAVIGKLYALSSIAGILGTFISGFYLLPQFGFRNILFFIVLILVITSIIPFIVSKNYKLTLIPIVLFTGLIYIWQGSINKKLSYIDTDTKYSRGIIYNTKDKPTGRPVKMLKVNDEKSSAMFSDKDDDLVFEVLKYYKLIDHFTPHFQNTLMIGGSGYAFPKYYLNNYPEATIDVVEIDPGLTKLANEHFNLVSKQGLEIFHEDGRTFINRTKRKYDAILMDAYKSMITIPFQLTTREAIQKIFDILNPGGAIYANIISSLNDNNNEFLRSQVAIYNQIFPQVYLFPIQYPNPEGEEKNHFQNFMLVALKSTTIPEFKSENKELNSYLEHLYIPTFDDGIILTDEYAPVEYFAVRALH